MTKRVAIASVVASAACFATLGVLTKWAFAHGATPLSLLAVRFAGAALVLWVVQGMRDPASLRVARSDLARFLGLSLTGYGAASLCYMYAVREAGAAVTTVLLFTYPALVSLIGWALMREPMALKRVAAVAVTFAGCALVSGALSPGRQVGARGLLLGLGAGLAYAVYSLLSFRTLARTSRMTLMAYTFAFSALGSGIVATVTGDVASVPGWDAAAWVATFLITAVPTLAAVILYLGGIRGLGTQRAAVVSTLELPFAVLVAAALYADERLGPLQIAGAVVVLVGVLLAEWDAPAGEVDAAAV